jgi:hypothetical protein
LRHPRDPMRGVTSSIPLDAGNDKEAAMVTGAHDRPRREPAGYDAGQEEPVPNRRGR